MSRIPSRRAGFLSTLFDLSFTRFATTSVIRVLYLLALGLVLLAGAIALLSGLFSGDAGQAIGALLIVPLFTLFFVIYVRVLLELVVVIFRINDNTQRIADAVAGGGRSLVDQSGDTTGSDAYRNTATTATETTGGTGGEDRPSGPMRLPAPPDVGGE